MQEDDHPYLEKLLQYHLEKAYLALAITFRPIWHQEGATTWFFTPHEPLALCNGVMRTSTTASDIDPVIEQVLEQAKERQASLTWLVGPSSTPADLSLRLLAAGLVEVETVTGMLLDLQDYRAQPIGLPRFQIRTVTTKEEMDAWVSTLVSSFGMSEATQDLFLRLCHARDFTPHASPQFFLGMLDDVPVATALLFLDDVMFGIYGVATVASQRRRGIGTLMMQQAIDAARHLGCTDITLQATAMGEALSRRLGFQPICLFKTYLWTPMAQGFSSGSQEGVERRSP